MRHVSPRVLAFLKGHESLRLSAYQDVRGKWTIGWGHTTGVKQGDVCTVVQAEDWFDDDVDWAEAGVEALCANLVVTQGEFDALVAFAFNVGVGKFKKSTLLRKFVGGDLPGAAAEFPKWCHSNGKVYDDLVKRRAQEVEWFREA